MAQSLIVSADMYIDFDIAARPSFRVTNTGLLTASGVSTGIVKVKQKLKTF
jgi:hypothetical protein